METKTKQMKPHPEIYPSEVLLDGRGSFKCALATEIGDRV
jgi:hypothetical protein